MNEDKLFGLFLCLICATVSIAVVCGAVALLAVTGEFVGLWELEMTRT